MRIDSLEAHNVAPDILAIWRKTVGPELLPVQERAVKEFGLFGEGNLIVFSPTSSGKTFIGEMAAVKAARENGKVLYLVPQKALAEEKYHELKRRYGPLGIKVVVSSRDHREYDEEIERREFQVAVVVFEKLQALLVSRPQLMEAVGLVVVDELQLITDEERGPALELLLTKLRLAGSRPRILGLSAVLGRAQVLADWLGARLLVDTQRPVELRKGVLCQGTFTYREHNSGKQGTESFADSGADERHELVLSAAEQLARRGEQVLVFLPDRASTVSYARLLADRVRLPAVEAALDELREQEETHAREALQQVLSSSVAFHNADLSPEERSLVEWYFRSGAIRVLFSTSTLAMGLNLPAKNVVLDGKRWQFLRRYGRWSLEDVSRSEYENMSGRAGRLSLTRDFGRSILVTRSPFEAEVWLEHYVGAQFEDIVPTLQGAPLENHVLDLLASGLARSRQELLELLLSSFTGFVYWSQKMSRDEFGAALDGALARCEGGGLLRAEGDGRLAVTELGRACAGKGLGVDTGVALAAWAREARAAALSEVEVLAQVSLTPAGGEVHVNLGQEERFRSDYRGELLRRAAEAGVAGRPVFERLASQAGAVEYDVARALKKTLLLGDWIGETRTQELEQRYQVWAGSLRRLGEEYAWLVESLAAIAQASGWPQARCRELEALSRRLALGVRHDALEVARLRVPGLGRGLVRRLVDAGYGDAGTLREAGSAKVQEMLGRGRAAGALWAKLEEQGGGEHLQRYPPAEPASALARLLRVAEPTVEYEAGAQQVPEEPEPGKPLLMVDLREHKVTYRGCAIPTRPPDHLQRQPLLVLAVLAGRAGTVVSMAELAEGLRRLGLAKPPRAADAAALRYKLLRPFRRALAGTGHEGEVDKLVESIPGVGLRLNLLPAAAVVEVA